VNGVAVSGCSKPPRGDYRHGIPLRSCHRYYLLAVPRQDILDVTEHTRHLRHDVAGEDTHHDTPVALKQEILASRTRGRRNLRLDTDAFAEFFRGVELLPRIEVLLESDRAPDSRARLELIAAHMRSHSMP
jgi:hypothetical protein